MNDDHIAPLLRRVVSTVAIERLTLRNLRDSGLAFSIGNATSLQYLDLTLTSDMAPVNFSKLVNLSSLQLTDNSPTNASAYVSVAVQPLLSTLHSFSSTGTQLHSSVFANFTSLAYLSFTVGGTFGMFDGSSSAMFNTSHLPVSLATLVVLSMPNTISTLDFSATQLISLSISNGMYSTLQLPPTLSELSVQSWSGTASGLAPFVAPLPATLTQFHFIGPTNYPGLSDALFTSATSLTLLEVSACILVHTLPNITHLSSLTSVILTSMQLPTPDPLCNLSRSIQTLVLDSSINSLLPLPSCLAEFTSLQTLSLSHVAYVPITTFDSIPSSLKTINAVGINFVPGTAAFNWTSFVERVPNLQTLDMTTSQVSGPFPVDLLQLSNLVSLSLSNAYLSGTLPADLGTRLPNLTILELDSNLLTGIVPTTNMSNLSTLNLAHNQFVGMETPSPPLSLLASLNLGFNSLVSIPNDTVFRQMTALVRLDLQSNPTLRGTPLPQFWADASSNLSLISLGGCGFVGTIPPIYAPYISALLLGSNQLCGPLPELHTHSSHLDQVDFSANTLSGTLPKSFANAAFVSLDLSNNYLSGSITNDVFSIGSQLLLQSFRVNSNNFFGPLLDISPFKILLVLSLSDTLLSLCEQNPNITSLTQSISCSIFGLPNSGDCICKDWYPCDYTSSGCPTLPPPIGTTPPAIDHYAPYPLCASTPVSIPIIPVCDPSTRPSPLFYCYNGVWVAPGTIEAPTISVSTPVIVHGSMDVPVVTITGLQGSVVVTGCINTTTVHLTLTPAEVEQLSKSNKPSSQKSAFLTQNGANCSQSLDTLNIEIGTTKKVCQKVYASTDTVQSSQSTLFVAFKIDALQCKVWWIAVISVIGFIVIVAIIFAIVAIAWKPLRVKIMPYRKVKRNVNLQ